MIILILLTEVIVLLGSVLLVLLLARGFLWLLVKVLLAIVLMELGVHILLFESSLLLRIFLVSENVNASLSTRWGMHFDRGC